MSCVGQSMTRMTPSGGDVLLEAVHAEVDELAALAVHGVLGHHSDGAVVAEQGGRGFLREGDGLQAATKPEGLVAGFRGGDEL